MNGNWVDIVILLPLAWGLVRGLYKGLVMSLGSIAALLCGIFGANAYASDLSTWIKTQFVLADNQAHALSYLLLFVAISLGCLLVAKLFDRFLKSVALSGINRLLGGVFGVVKYALIVSILLNVFNEFDQHIHFVSDETKSTSVLYQPVSAFVPTVFPIVQFYVRGEGDEGNQD